MRTIHYLLLVVWASYCLAAPTPGRDAAATDVPTSSAHIPSHANFHDQLIHGQMALLRASYMQNVVFRERMLDDLRVWVLRDVTAYVEGVEKELDSQSGPRSAAMSSLKDMRDFISSFPGHIEPASDMEKLMSNAIVHIAQVLERATQIKVQRQAHQSTEAVTDRDFSNQLQETESRSMPIGVQGNGAESIFSGRFDVSESSNVDRYPKSDPIARPRFIDFLGVGAEPESQRPLDTTESPNVHPYLQSGSIASPMLIDFFAVESERQRRSDVAEAPTRSATGSRDDSLRLSNPHDYSRHDSTHTGSGSTSGGPRLRDHSNHGAGPSDDGNPRSKIQRTEVRGRGKGLE
ncbi:hypothetical protein SeLEV6574_g06480 [Synchytrium endobioticum]|uniref:Uncharacterized protein n=1 Tax=Synchytrium endobioticum TaxID=286115 RepID=A0A507CNI1_9FUNG|nr:hypothetical protein SeLEV6574_g06480 [Synchytrium endobioticum]